VLINRPVLQGPQHGPLPSRGVRNISYFIPCRAGIPCSWSASCVLKVAELFKEANNVSVFRTCDAGRRTNFTLNILQRVSCASVIASHTLPREWRVVFNLLPRVPGTCTHVTKTQCYSSFAVVRDPVERMISHYYHFTISKTGIGLLQYVNDYGIDSVVRSTGGYNIQFRRLADHSLAILEAQGSKSHIIPYIGKVTLQCELARIYPHIFGNNLLPNSQIHPSTLRNTQEEFSFIQSKVMGGFYLDFDLYYNSLAMFRQLSTCA